MEEILANQTIHHLLRCLTELNVSDSDETCIEGVISGRIVAQVLTQLLKSDLSDEELWKIANAENDEEIPKSDYALNWRIIMDRVPMLFPKQQYDLSRNELWKFDIDELLGLDVDAIIRALIIFLSSAIVSEMQVRNRILDLLESFPQDIKDDLTNRLRNFIDLIEINQGGGDAESSGNSAEIRHYKVKLNEMTQARDRLKKENDALSTELAKLREQSESWKISAQESQNLQKDLDDSKLKIKFLENSLETTKAHLLSSQNKISELEYQNNELNRLIKHKEQDLDLLNEKFRDLSDECDALRDNETTLRASLKQKADEIRELRKDSKKIKDLQDKLNTSDHRIDNYIAMLAETESLRTKISSMEQLLENHAMQRDKLSTDLSDAELRAKDLEAKLARAKQELRRANTSSNAVDEESPKPQMSLHDELNFSASKSNGLSEEAQLADEKAMFQKHLNKAADVIRFYSEGQESDNLKLRNDNLKLRNENAKLQREIESLRAKNDQHRQESCQEQRLITANIFNVWLKQFEASLNKPVNNGTSSGADSSRHSFVTRQLQTSNFTASSSSARLNSWRKVLLWLLLFFFVFTFVRCMCCIYNGDEPCTLFGKFPPLVDEYILEGCEY